MKVLHKDHLRAPAFSLKNKLVRVLWGVVYIVLFKFSPVPLFRWRTFLLNCFGGKIDRAARIYPSAKIWYPANLCVAAGATIGPAVNVYNQGAITIATDVIVSQGAHLCASTHDYNDPLHPLILAPITVGANAWICAEAFVGPGVNVAEGCVIGARAVLTKNTQAWGVYAGNPAVKRKGRENFTDA